MGEIGLNNCELRRDHLPTIFPALCHRVMSLLGSFLSLFRIIQQGERTPAVSSTNRADTHLCKLGHVIPTATRTRAKTRNASQRTRVFALKQKKNEKKEESRTARQKIKKQSTTDSQQLQIINSNTEDDAIQPTSGAAITSGFEWPYCRSRSIAAWSITRALFMTTVVPIPPPPPPCQIQNRSQIIKQAKHAATEQMTPPSRRRGSAQTGFRTQL